MPVREINSFADLYYYLQSLSDQFEKLGVSEIAAQLKRASLFAYGIPTEEFVCESKDVLLSVQKMFAHKLTEEQREELDSAIGVIKKGFRDAGRPW